VAFPSEGPERTPASSVFLDQELPSRLDEAVSSAQRILLDHQNPDGHWCFELETDCTIPAEYILMMHYVGIVDPRLQDRFRRYLRQHQDLSHGGWPLYSGGDFDLSCSVKCYYALKLAGEDPESPVMEKARMAILRAGGAAHCNVFTRITLYFFRQLPRRAIPFIPVEIILLPRWFPFHLSKVSYWSRTVMVPLLILCSLRARAANPLQVGIRELFVVPPEEEHHYFRITTRLGRFFLLLDRAGRGLEPLIPRPIRRQAIDKARNWFCERLNGESGLGAIFPAMVNAYEALLILGYPRDHPLCLTAWRAIERLVVERDGMVYCQPCVSPVWDTALAVLALEETGDCPDAPIRKGMDWLRNEQVTEVKGDWALQRPHLAPGGWAFQYANPYYPDLDDTAIVGWVIDRSKFRMHYIESIEKSANWTVGMQSRNGGFASFDVDNTHYYLNEIPFADHGALLDPPTSDVSAHVLGFLGRLGRGQDRDALERCLSFLRSEQEPTGAWFGRWGTNYIYGTAHVLIALEEAHIDMSAEWIQKAAQWLTDRQREDGGWGEGNDTYFHPERAGQGTGSTSFQTSWALLGLMAAGQSASPTVRRGVDYLLRTQTGRGDWRDRDFTAPGFPRVFYLKYHGYSLYFPLWALARYRSRVVAPSSPGSHGPDFLRSQTRGAGGPETD
jgi:squalene-hopene/tetraprenyl-beta-curcumene cyclase